MRQRPSMPILVRGEQRDKAAATSDESRKRACSRHTPCAVTEAAWASRRRLAYRRTKVSCYGTRSVPATLLRQFHRADVPKQQIRRRIVPLNGDHACALAEALPRILTRRTLVGPVAHLVALDPHSHVRPVGNDGLREPLVIVGHDAAGRLAAIDSAGAEIGRLGAVAVAEHIIQLAFVSGPAAFSQRAKENAAVQPVAVNL